MYTSYTDFHCRCSYGKHIPLSPLEIGAVCRVEVTGIFRAVPKRVNPKMRVVRSVYKTYVDVIHFR